MVVWLYVCTYVWLYVCMVVWFYGLAYLWFYGFMAPVPQDRRTIPNRTDYRQDEPTGPTTDRTSPPTGRTLRGLPAGFYCVMGRQDLAFMIPTGPRLLRPTGLLTMILHSPQDLVAECISHRTNSTNELPMLSCYVPRRTVAMPKDLVC